MPSEKTIRYCATWNAAGPHSSSKVNGQGDDNLCIYDDTDLGTRTHIYENNGTLANMKRANKQAKIISMHARP